ncbi:MAG: AI-2E family transporter [Bacilli bacterium]|nr:AI-2E family transporter [Bacilli bacterium]
MKENRKLDSDKLNKLINRSNKLVNLLYILFIIGVFLIGLIIIKELKLLILFKTILKVLTPLFIGFVIAWLFNPLVNKISGKGVPKVLGAIIVYLVLILLIIMFIKVFIPVLYKQLNDLIIALPGIINKLTKIFDDFMVKFSVEGIDLSNVRNNLFNSINSLALKFTTSMPKHVINFILSFFSGLGILLISLVVGIYMLIDFDHITIHLIKLIPKKYQSEILNLIEKIGCEVRKTVNGTILVALMVLVGDTIAFSIIGLESPLLFGTFCGLTDLIPYIGPYIGGFAAIIVGFSQKTSIGIAVLIACVIVQLIENYILQPIVMSKAIELHPVTIIIGLLLFGHFFGIIGMVIATPVLALLKVIYEYICQKLELFS